MPSPKVYKIYRHAEDGTGSNSLMRSTRRTTEFVPISYPPLLRLFCVLQHLLPRDVSHNRGMQASHRYSAPWRVEYGVWEYRLSIS